MDFLHCMELNEAQRLMEENLTGSLMRAEFVELSDALGRITAEDIMSTEDLPPFARSTVDGFAVRSEDTFGASESAGALFSIIGEVSMGKETKLTIDPGEAVTVPTGGMLPGWADAVVMLEYTEQPDEQTLLIQKMVAPNENVMTRGEDISAGACIVRQGVRITPQHIGLLAACGCHHLSVRQKIKVALISSGDELVDIHETPGVRTDPGCKLIFAGGHADGAGLRSEAGWHREGQFRAFSVLPFGCCRQFSDGGGLSGGSSVGAKDFTVPAMQALGGPGILIHGLAIKPGKPTIFGMAGAVPVFGLPGHPVAALTVCGQLVAAAVHLMTGGPGKKHCGRRTCRIGQKYRVGARQR